MRISQIGHITRLSARTLAFSVVHQQSTVTCQESKKLKSNIDKSNVVCFKKSAEEKQI